jgi:peptidoglycan/xylan/chitin deacetylase (PgdA/CDA1 family)
MSEDEIKKWINEGMEIGAHTQNHIHLSNCDTEVAKKEIMGSAWIKLFLYPSSKVIPTTLPCFFPVK